MNSPINEFEKALAEFKKAYIPPVDPEVAYIFYDANRFVIAVTTSPDSEFVEEYQHVVVPYTAVRDYLSGKKDLRDAMLNGSSESGYVITHNEPESRFLHNLERALHRIPAAEDDESCICATTDTDTMHFSLQNIEVDKLNQMLIQCPISIYVVCKNEPAYLLKPIVLTADMTYPAEVKLPFKAELCDFYVERTAPIRMTNNENAIK